MTEINELLTEYARWSDVEYTVMVQEEMMQYIRDLFNDFDADSKIDYLHGLVRGMAFLSEQLSKHTDSYKTEIETKLIHLSERKEKAHD